MEISKCCEKLNLQKFQIKMKICKTFYEAKKTSRFNGIIQPPHPPTPPTHASSDKILLRLFLQSTSRMQFWASRKGGVQVFFLTWNMFAGNFLVNSERFWLCCKDMLFSMSTELRFRKWVRCLDRNRIVKWVIFFGSLCWLWDFLQKNLKLKKNSYKNWIFI